MEDKILSEAARLHAEGFAIHWLHNKSKRPIESGWTTGPRKQWQELRKSYKKGLNVGVRLGRPSEIKGTFLAVIDVDIKSQEDRHRQEVMKRLEALIPKDCLPEVQSGRGNGSRHYYILTPRPLKPFKLIQSPDLVRVHMPSVAPSKREVAALTIEELKAGWRLRPAYEIALMGDGQQVVLPPSVHPDSGLEYKWQVNFNAGLAAGFDSNVLQKPEPLVTTSKEPAAAKPGPKTLEGFEVVDVEISWLPIPENIRQMILTGEGVEDRSAMLLPVSQALLRSGLTQNEVLSVLTNKDTFLGKCAYQHAKTLDRVKAAAWVYRFTLKRVIEENATEGIFAAPITKPIELSFDQIEAQQLLFDKTVDHWMLHLDQTKNDMIRGTLRNVVMIIENEIGEDAIKRDLFSFRDFYNYETPWGGEAQAAIVDEDLTKIKLWLGNNFGFEPNKNIIGEALTMIAFRNGFDPVIDALNALPEWDGVERLDGWLAAHFHAKGDAEYLAQVFRKWMVAMVARALDPGTKFDWMPIFEGAQGVGKSSFGRILCGDKHFLDWLPDLANKDSALALQGIWAVEMGELASFRKNEIETVKAFITRTVDKVRPPYGERWLEIPRRCVFFGTTNFETYLRDDSGNRRFKPVKVGRLDFAKLREERAQLFAEALWLYRAGFETSATLDTHGEARVYERNIQSEKMVADEATLMTENLLAFIDSEFKKEEDERFNFSKFKIGDLFEQGQGSLGRSFMGQVPFKNWKYDSRNVQFAAKSLKLAGAANWKSDGTKYWKLTNILANRAGSE